MGKRFDLWLVCLVLTIFFLPSLCMAEDRYTDYDIAERIELEGDFTAKFEVERANGSCDGGLMFYQDGAGNAYGFKVRWNEDKRVDFYGVKDVAGEWKGFLIPEEYQETKKDSYVSLDEGWDASADTKVTMTVQVEGTKATVTLKGDVTGKSGTLTFDLTKSPYLGGYTETDPIVLSSGEGFLAGSGNFLSLTLAAAGNENNDVWVDYAISDKVPVSGDFAARYTVDVSGTDVNGGLMFYDDGAGNSYGVKVNQNGNWLSVYAVKNFGGQWGFLIAEEYQANGWTKDCWVSWDDGWTQEEVANETAVDVTVTVTGTNARVDIHGQTTGKSATVNFDLTDSAFLGDWLETDPAVHTNGSAHFEGSENQMSNFGVLMEKMAEKIDTSIWYPHNTMCLAGLAFRDEVPGLTEKWYTFAPIDLSYDGIHLYNLVASNIYTIGTVEVRVQGDEVIVTWKNLFNYGDNNFLPESEFLTFLPDLDSVTSVEPEDIERSFEFGKPISIANDLGGDTQQLLYIRNMATYCNYVDNARRVSYPRNPSKTRAYAEMLGAMRAQVNRGRMDAVNAAEYVDIPLDTSLQLNGDFSARIAMERADGACDGGLLFYTDEEGNAYGFKVRWNEDRRMDFYGVKNVGGSWKGFLIAEENQEWMKDCYVSLDEGWDASADTRMTMTITVQGTKAIVMVQGNVTGMSGMLTFDLTKSPWLDWEETEANPIILNAGSIAFEGAGNFVSLAIDSETWAANQP